MSEIAERMTRARTHLLLDHPWFGMLSLNLDMQPSDAVPTLGTNGTALLYNPTYCAERTDAELQGLLAHEVMHCALLHPYRTNGRDAALWNVACDLAINPHIRASDLTLPEGKNDPREAEFVDWSAEAIYAKLRDEQQQTGNAPTPDLGNDVQPAPQGGSDDEPQPGDEPGEAQQPQGMTEMDWQVAAEQMAMVARRAGAMPSDAQRAINELREPTVDWRTILRRFVEQTVPSDYSWTSPNRRYIAAGLYLPGAVKENTPRLAVAVDTSGSISQEQLDEFASEITAIMLETRPAAIDVVYCDASVQGTQMFTPDDGELRLEARGGGGTRFQPVFDWLEEQEEQPAALIYCTDLESSDLPVETGVPVLWVTPEWVRRDGPFGETVRLAA